MNFGSQIDEESWNRNVNYFISYYILALHISNIGAAFQQSTSAYAYVLLK